MRYNLKNHVRAGQYNLLVLNNRVRQLLRAIGLLVLVGASYAYTVQCEWIWDDDSYVTENPVLVEPGGLGRIWLELRATPQYYPMVFTTFWVEHQLWGLDPTGYHVVNLLLHALAAVLWWRVLLRLNVPGAWLAAAIFALHPVHVESVAWVTERKNVLSGVFYAGALLAWLRFSPPDGEASKAPRRWGFYGLCVVLFVAALLSKTVTSTLPAVIALGLWWRCGSLRAIGRRNLAALTPLFVIGVGMGLITVWLEKHHVGAEGVEWGYSFIERCLIAGRVIWFYAAKLIWPAHLVFIYPRWTIDAGDPVQWLYPIGVLAVIAALALGVRRFGRGPLTGVLFFIGTLFPALGFFDVFPMRYSFVADHFQYLASMGLIVLFAAGCAKLTERMGIHGQRALAAILLIALGALTWRQTHQYENEYKLWTTTLERNPSAGIAANNLGTWFHRSGDDDQAMAFYQRAIELDPNSAETMHNIGEMLRLAGRHDDALPYFQRQVEVAPNALIAQLDLGVLLVELDRPEDALPHLREAIKLNPNHNEANRYLADALFNLGRFDQAIEHYAVVLAHDPDDADAHNRVAMALGAVGRSAAAAAHFQDAVRLRPNDVQIRYNLALTLARLGQSDQALAQLRQGLTIDPDASNLLDLFSQVHAFRGEMTEAIEAANRAIGAAEAAGETERATALRARIQSWSDGGAAPR